MPPLPIDDRREEEEPLDGEPKPEIDMFRIFKYIAPGLILGLIGTGAVRGTVSTGTFEEEEEEEEVLEEEEESRKERGSETCFCLASMVFGWVMMGGDDCRGDRGASVVPKRARRRRLSSEESMLSGAEEDSMEAADVSAG